MKRFVLGLTGGMGSGKSTVLALFRKAGIPVLSADELAHQCLETGDPVAGAIRAHFGKIVAAAGGGIDRRALGRIVFGDRRARRWLEKKIHPHVLREIRRFIRRKTGLVVVDVPLLFEAGWRKEVNGVAVVYAQVAQVRERLQKRDRLSPTEIRRRLAAQWPLVRKKRLADYLIDNTRGRSFLRKEVCRVLTLLSNKP